MKEKNCLSRRFLDLGVVLGQIKAFSVDFAAKFQRLDC